MVYLLAVEQLRAQLCWQESRVVNLSEGLREEEGVGRTEPGLVHGPLLCQANTEDLARGGAESGTDN